MTKQSFAKVMILVTVILMDILGGAEIDLFIPSFPELKTQFGLSPFLVEALLSVNFIGYCLSLLFVGGLADRYGRKPIILIGLVIFTVGSILCVKAPSYEFLLIGRFLQGVGVAAPATLCFLIVADSYTIKQQQYLFGVLNGVVNASIAAAPVAGSYITMYFHWQGNFSALLGLGLIVLVMTVFFIPTSKLSHEKEPLSLAGYIPIFRSKNLLLLIASIVFICVPYWIFIGISPILYMEDLGVSLAHFGYYQGALALVFSIGSIISGLIINKYDNKKILFFSTLICIVCLFFIILAAIFDTRNPFFITFAFLLFSMGAVLPATILYPLCLNYMPHAKGRVAALLQGLRLIITALFLQLTGYYYRGSFQNIGIIITCAVFIAIIFLFLIIKNREVMKFSEQK